jgi:hypothetical protein
LTIAPFENSTVRFRSTSACRAAPFVKGFLLSGLDNFSNEVFRPDSGDAGCEPAFVKLWTTLDEPGDDRTNGLSISLEADTPVSRLPLSESRMDLDVRLTPGEGSDGVADVVVGVVGREIV